ncbi:uncharacterized protein LOC115632868 [Scaptodrosophila lebanonensis]|uniref:Uncharacterized protein LOC115632868 n=1 Tax=Drosophila lebanonensis TaxID=7225 RepID=A0A6J2UFV6_DROLE|nr:uncharacterized protein LOC115632868 [Scaptodrosophila lebanonensis]
MLYSMDLNVSASQVPTYGPEAESMHKLMSSPPLRRSQRLLDKTEAVVAAKSIENREHREIRKTKSPQLFTETDEECSQLPPNRPTGYSLKGVLSLALSQEQQPTALSQVQNHVANNNGSIELLKKKPAAAKRSRNPNPSKARSQTNCAPKKTTNQKRGNSRKLKETVTASLPGPTTTAAQPISGQASSSLFSISGQPTQIAEAILSAPSSLLQYRTPIVNRNTAAPYNRHAFSAALGAAVTSTQSLLPAQYPEHFVHQIPPLQQAQEQSPNATTYLTDIKAELQRVAFQRAINGVGPPIQKLISEIDQGTSRETTAIAAKLCHICPSQDTTPLALTATYGEIYGQSSDLRPRSPQTSTSTSPSLSESLAEIFGTTKIRNALQIANTRKYRLQDEHLPAIAVMLNVDLNRLRAVLDITEQLTYDQLQEMCLTYKYKSTPDDEIDDEEMPTVPYKK